MKATQPLWRYRLAVASRTLAAAVGGYALAAAFTAAAAHALAQAMPRVEAVLTATMLAWLVYAAGVAWVFFARSAWQAWCGMLLPALALGLAAQLPQWLAGAA